MKIGVVQITSDILPEVNLEKIDKQLTEAKSLNCEAVFLPEVFFSKGLGLEQTPHIVETTGDYWNSIVDLVKKHQIYVLGGSVVFNDNGIIRNRSLNFNPDGSLIDYYDKIHLFACDVEFKEENRRLKVDEGDLYTPGNTPKSIEVGPMKLGLTICFDVRYPQMYQAYRKEGCNAFSISSAFTVPTGKAHWETLVRARAIENQSYVFASCQWGKHNKNMTSFGHSLIVDPWGEIVANAEEGEKLITGTFDQSKIDEARARVLMK